MSLHYSFKKISACVILFVLVACTPTEKPFTGVKIGKPYEINGQTYVPAPSSSYDKIGDGSWYGPGFNGNRTASGEIFNQDDITAAHPTLPMPSLVKVTNLSNDKSVVVRINDRGPFHNNRIIDLSRKSARIIDLKSTKPVRVQYLDKETEEYLASIQGQSPKIDMVEYNENYNKKLAENAASERLYAANEVENFAPVQSVAINDLEKPTKPPIAASASKEILKSPEPRKHFAFNNAVAGGEVQLIGQDEASQPSKQSESTVLPVKTSSKNLPSTPAKGSYIILAGSFSSEENARKLVDSLSSIPNHDKLVSIDKVEISGKEWWRVNVGSFADKDSAKQALRIIQDAGMQDAILKKAQ